MKVLRFVIYIFYRYYSKGGTKRIPYFSALCAVVFLIYIHLFQLLILIDQVNLLPLRSNDSKIEKYGKVALFFLPIFFLVYSLIKPSDIQNFRYPIEKVKRGGIFLIVYIIASLTLLFILMFVFARR